MGVAALMTGIATAAMAQEQTQETEKPGFFKQAFRDMKDMYSTECITAFVNFLVEDYLHFRHPSATHRK